MLRLRLCWRLPVDSFCCVALALLAMDASTAADTRLPYPFFLFDGEFGDPGREDGLPAIGVESSSDPCLLDPGVARLFLLHGAADSPLTTSGDGKGVRSVMAARYGEGSAEFAEPGESDEDPILAVERVERSDELMTGR